MDVVDLEVIVVKGESLRNVEWPGCKQDPFCELSMASKVRNEKRRTFTHWDGEIHPVWNQLFTFEKVDASLTLSVKVQDDNQWPWPSVLIGVCSLQMKEVLDGMAAGDLDQRHRLAVKYRNKVDGIIELKIRPIGGAYGQQLSMARQQRNATMSHIMMTGRQETVRSMTGESPFLPDNYAQTPQQPYIPPTPAVFIPEQARASWILGTSYRSDQRSKYGYPEDCKRIETSVQAGSKGIIYVATDQDFQHKVMLTRYPKELLRTVEDKEWMRQQVKIMEALSLIKNVARLEDVWETEEDVFMATEFCAGGELFDVLCSRSQQLSEQESAAIIRKLVETVKHIHQLGIVHRDITPESLLFKQSCTPEDLRIANFSSATEFVQGIALHEKAGSIPYIAPEVLAGSYTAQADMWSVGVILYVLLSGRTPYPPEMSVADYAQQVRTNPPALQGGAWETISDAAKQCLWKLLQVDPHERATPDAILEDDWIREGGVATLEVVTSDVLTMIRFETGLRKLQLLARREIANNLPYEQTEDLIQLFQEMDENGDEMLSKQEIEDFLLKVDLGAYQHLLESIWRDMQEDEEITLDEFRTCMLGDKDIQESSLKKAFAFFDEDCDGLITFHELDQVLRREGIYIDDLPMVMATADVNGDGGIDFEEFKDLLQ